MLSQKTCLICLKQRFRWESRCHNVLIYCGMPFGVLRHYDNRTLSKTDRVFCFTASKTEPPGLYKGEKLSQFIIGDKRLFI